VIDADIVIIAIGTSPNPMIFSGSTGLETNSRGTIIVDDFGKTSLDNVYAGGDAVTGAATVISAMGAGKLAAQGINKYLSN
jgi:glutamate synthase (NADPH/NADH) small chain